MDDEKMKKHNRAVRMLAGKVKDFATAGVKFRLYHGETNSTRLSTRKADEVLDISALNNILKIDKNHGIAIVEPNVSMSALVAATLKHGLLPQVVPEFPGITVGGSFSGTAAESSSFKFGYFDQSVNWAEFILADGRVVRASAKDNSDLFHGSVGACGTIGIGTLFEIKLVEARRFVELRYIPITSMSDAVEKLSHYTGNLTFVNFVEAILFGPTSGVVIVGTLTDEAKSGVPIVRFSRPQDPWYFLHAHESVAHARHTNCDTCAYTNSRNPCSKGTVVEVVPVADYVFRYDRGVFWMGIYGQQPSTFNRLTRFLIDPLMRTSAMYKTMHHSGRSQSFIIQDLAIPQESVEKFLTWADDALHIYPIWLCPIKSDTSAPLHLANGLPTTRSIINVGLWGLKTSAWPFFENPIGAAAFKRFIEDNRAIEAKVRELGGLKWLYAHNYYTEQEFWGIYDKGKYDGLRKKYGAEHLPSLWDKMNNTDVEYVEKKSFWKSIALTIIGREHLLS
ncbi:FAD binding domain-containing protein [Colletotrichum karsti]|uniref:Delta(24)-sterol reductase n=1 Tax=Colletotrichum karsti TaxID=1095194 RepID=A0A9P6I0X0_9PEZI|nr:FAD binding domain-containing protein [Colletotrichum karsti]KAF9869845.1 FAD binding domain-containing protein [Colletotrichum karsti]